MVIFHSYVSLAEGMFLSSWWIFLTLPLLVGWKTRFAHAKFGLPYSVELCLWVAHFRIPYNLCQATVMAIY